MQAAKTQGSNALGAGSNDGWLMAQFLRFALFFVVWPRALGPRAAAKSNGNHAGGRGWPPLPRLIVSFCPTRRIV
jgi:hypothetical protein